MVVGSVVWAYILGGACSLIASRNVENMLFRNRMDDLTDFCHVQNLSRPEVRCCAVAWSHGIVVSWMVALCPRDGFALCCAAPANFAMLPSSSSILRSTTHCASSFSNDVI